MKVVKLTAKSLGSEIYYNVDNIVCFVRHKDKEYTSVWDVTQDEVDVLETPNQIIALINSL